MQVGVVFPQTEMGDDVGAIRAYAQAVEASGFDHLISYDHVVGVDPAVRDYEQFKGYYDIASRFHEPLVLYGYLAAITDLELVTAILILPQRQTALVAKQAAEVDLLSGGRFRLGVGIGWNPFEYEALGKSFTDRGARLSEQVELLRALWTTPTVSFSGAYEQVVGAGLAPLPIQRPIPIWFGAVSPAALRRAGRLADGWFPQRLPGAGFEEDRATVDAAATEAGRDPASIGVEGRVRYDTDLSAVTDGFAAWRAAGATHVSVDTMKQGLSSVDDHIAAIEAVAHALELPN